MNIEKLKKSLEEYYNNSVNIGISVYALLKENANPLQVDIENDAQNGLKDLFIARLRETISEKEELSLLHLSSADERVDAIYIYDLEIPDTLSSLEKIVSNDNFPKLNLESNKLSEIKTLLIEIGNNDRQLVLYKTIAPINIFGKTGFFLAKSKNRLKKMGEEFLRISLSFQMMRINGELLVFDLGMLEKNFGFHDVIKREASLGCDAIERASLLDNPYALRELISDVRYARKLTKVAKSSPVLTKRITGKSIIQFCKNYPALKGKIKFNENEDRIILDTKTSKDLFIKVLMDDFLTSELTNFHYMTVAKDSVEESPTADHDQPNNN